MAAGGAAASIVSEEEGVSKERRSTSELVVFGLETGAVTGAGLAAAVAAADGGRAETLVEVLIVDFDLSL